MTLRQNWLQSSYGRKHGRYGLKLRAGGYKIALCSNLAASYGPALLGVLPETADALILSYQTGFIKPEAGIYGLVCEKLNLPPQSIFFTGDTQLADVDGPKAFGMEAELIEPFIKRAK